MQLLHRVRVWAWLASAACAFAYPAPLHPEQPDSLSMQTSTRERLDAEAWWPTKSGLPLDAFAGSQACIRCHQEQDANPSSSMQRAAARAVDTRFLKGSSTGAYNSAPYAYSLAVNPTGLNYTVTRNNQRVSQKLDWVIGAGTLGRTFLYQTDGRWYQSEATYYTNASALDITTGLSRSAPEGDLAAALGQALSKQDAISCFGCHTVHSTTSAGLNPLHAEAGLGCEACHGPGSEHAGNMSRHAEGAARDHHSAPADSLTIFNPAKLSPVDSIDFCGACHRTFVDAKLSMGNTSSTAVVRFQPYRLEESKCWRATQDERLTCTACHDPHQPLNRNLASYDKHCVECHTTIASASPTQHAAKVCPKASSQCVSCHMPKVTVPSMHGDFTDHYIRIARAGDDFPH